MREAEKADARAVLVRDTCHTRSLGSFGMSLISFLFPPTCVRCGAFGEVICEPCEALVPIPENTLQCPPGACDIYAATLYEDHGRQLIYRLKSRHDVATVSWFADRLAPQLLQKLHASNSPAVRRSIHDVAITWVPPSARGLRERGIEPTRLLARHIARALNVREFTAFTRLDQSAQTTKHRLARRRGPRFSFVCDGELPSTVVLVDDVITTGTTLCAAALLLRGAGVKSVIVAVGAAASLR